MIFLQCLLGFHKPNRSAVVREPLYYATHCLRCSAPLRRISKGRWVLKKEGHGTVHPHSRRPHSADVALTGTVNASRTDAPADRSDAGNA